MLNRRAPQRGRIGAQQTVDSGRPGSRVVPVDQGSAAPVGHRDRQPADGSGDHGGTAGLRLDRHQTEGLRVARHRHQIRGAVDVHKLLAGLRRQERDPLGDTQFTGQPDQSVGSGQAGARRTTGHQHPDTVGQQGRGAQQDVRRLERLDASDERDYRAAGRQSESSASRITVAGGEDLQVHAGVNDIDT